MRSGSIDAWIGELGKRFRHAVDLLHSRTLPTRFPPGKAIVRPMVRRLAGERSALMYVKLSLRLADRLADNEGGGFPAEIVKRSVGRRFSVPSWKWRNV